jgi:hypothetical protein
MDILDKIKDKKIIADTLDAMSEYIKLTAQIEVQNLFPDSTNKRDVLFSLERNKSMVYKNIKLGLKLINKECSAIGETPYFQGDIENVEVVENFTFDIVKNIFNNRNK